MSQFSATADLTAIATALTGQYEVDREIGRGGMGVVYLARDLRLDRLVAIKTLPARLAGDAATRERFLREARTAGRLSHPNIVPIHRADEINGQVFFVMGFVDGDSLAGRLSAGPLSPRDAVPILRDVASALGYAHKHGVVHRDVKTENILLESTTSRAMVTDFGIARVAEAAPLTATGQVLGTVYYLSPEQVAGDEVDARSDIYALGVVGYAALSGQFPFDGPLASAVLVAHVTKQPRPLATIAPHVPASLASIIDRCLAKDPTHRFQSCAELDSALAAAQSDANAVIVVRPATPRISDTEAHLVFKRAAELQDMTGMQPRPAITPTLRDPEKDARRSEGFKTANLREAAVEAGIDAKYVEQAFAERGLRPVPPPQAPAAARERKDKADRRPPNIVYDLTRKPTFFQMDPTNVHYEVVVDGEAPESDHDLIVDAVRRHWENKGVGTTVGRSFTWASTATNGEILEVSVLPRNGKTTIRVNQSFKKMTDSILTAVIGFGGVAGGGLAALMAAGTGPGGSIAVWSAFFTVSVAAGAVAAKAIAERRQKTFKAMTQDLAAQARESIDAMDSTPRRLKP